MEGPIENLLSVTRGSLFSILPIERSIIGTIYRYSLFTRRESSAGSCFRRLSLLFATLLDNVRVRDIYTYIHTHIGQSVARKHEEKCGVSCTGLLSRKTFAYAVEQGWNSPAIPVPVEAETRGGLVPTTRVVGPAPNWVFQRPPKEPANSLESSVCQFQRTCETRTRTRRSVSRVIKIAIIKVISHDGLFTRRDLSLRLWPNECTGCPVVDDIIGNARKEGVNFFFI